MSILRHSDVTAGPAAFRAGRRASASARLKKKHISCFLLDLLIFLTMVNTSRASGAAARRVAAATKPDHLLKASNWKSVKIPWSWCESGLRKVHERRVGTTIPTFNSADHRKGDDSPVSTITPEELFKLFPGEAPNVLCGFVSRGRTAKDYLYHIQAICRFCFLIADYESAMICCGVEKACPIAVETLCLCLRYKRGEKDSELLDDDGNQVFDPAGNAILCVGEWNDPHKQDQFVGAIITILCKMCRMTIECF